MLARTVGTVIVIVFLTSFILTLHSDVMLKMMQNKFCLQDYSQSTCKEMVQKGGSLLSLPKVLKDVQQWSRIFSMTSFAPSVLTVLIIAAVAGAVKKKENIWLYVSFIIAIQSLIYLTISIFKSFQVEHLLAGVILNIFIGDSQGAVLLAWVFAALVTDATLTRSLIFVAIEGMVYFGQGCAHFVTQFVSHYVPFSYFFAGTFTLAVLVFLLIYLVLPTSSDIVMWKYSKIDAHYYHMEEKGFFHFLFNPRSAIENEYVAGVILATFLAEFGKHLFNSIILQYLMDPPLLQSYHMSKIYLWGTISFQGVTCVITATLLTKIMFASDSTLVLLSLSCSAFWMVLISYTSSTIMLLIISICLSSFVPIAMAGLRSTVSKENGILSGYFILVLGVMSSFTVACESILVYSGHLFENANRSIYHPFTLIFAGILQLIAFIVVASVSWTFKKPLVEFPRRKLVTVQENQSKKPESTKTTTDDEMEEKDENDPFLID